MSGPDVVRITFRRLGGEQIVLEIPSAASVWDVKQMLQEQVEIPGPEQRFLHGTCILDDGATPFLEISQEGAEVQVLRQPRMNLEQFRKDLGHGETPLELNILLAETVRLEEPQVALEIVYHPDFCDLQGLPLKDRGDLLKTLAVSGFAEAFEALVTHERVGEVEGVLDAGFLALHHAASRGLVLHCRSLLNSPQFHNAAAKKGAVPPAPGALGNGTTALHHAANAKVLELLLKHPDLSSSEALNAIDRYGCTCLHYASTAEMCRLILGHPNFHSINLQDSSGQTALHRASSPGVCEEILKNPGFDSLRCLDSLGRTAAHVLARSEVMTSVLLQNAQMPPELLDLLDIKNRSCLHFAASENVCRQLFAAGFTQVNALDKSNRSALHSARNAGVARAILEHPNFKELNAMSLDTQVTALVQAVAISDDAMVSELLRAPGHQVDSLQAALLVSGGLSHETRHSLEEKLQRATAPEATSSYVCNVL